MSVLEQLAEYAGERVALAKKKIPLEEMKTEAFSLPKGNFAFEEALRKPGLSFICECKSPPPPGE